MLVGGLPTFTVSIAPAETDPTQLTQPGIGLLQMPTAPHFIANVPGYTAWRQPAPFAGESLFYAAHRLGLRTVVTGQPDFHTLHLDPASIDLTTSPTTDYFAYTAVQAALELWPRALILAALDGARTAERHSEAARAELAALGTALAKIVAAAPGALIVITSRGATTIDDPGADFYGPGSSRHVPLILLGPNVRPGVVTGQPAAPADLPATVLFGLGAPTTTDVANGTWATGTPVAGVPQPSPAGATAGRTLLRAFQLQPGF